MIITEKLTWLKLNHIGVTNNTADDAKNYTFYHTEIVGVLVSIDLRDNQTN